MFNFFLFLVVTCLSLPLGDTLGWFSVNPIVLAVPFGAFWCAESALLSFCWFARLDLAGAIGRE